jgi:uncharacterized phage protein (TIGR01671 family)
MRQFEFRAWENGKMYYQVRCGGVFDGIPTAPTVWSEGKGDWVNLTGQPHTKIMQWTGLKDVNDKKIYEGDIVKVWEEDVMIPNRDSGGGIIDFDEEEGFSQIGTVSFHISWFSYQTKKHLRGRKEEIFAPLDFVDGIEVIGNIFEDEELIKELK